MKAYCPVCGHGYKISIELKHKCPQSTLDAIDRSRKSDHDHRENRKPYGQRLHKGFEMLAKHDDSYMDDEAWENDE